MKKEEKILEILGAIAVFILAVGLFSQNQRIKKLEENLIPKEVVETKENETTKKQASKKGSEQVQTEECQYEQFAKLVFKYDNSEKEYVETTGGITFYSDLALEKEIGTSETLIFGSIHTNIVEINNTKVYACILKDGSLCYCKGDENVNIWIK